MYLKGNHHRVPIRNWSRIW